MNCLKIIATYLGPRRQNNNNFASYQETKNYLNLKKHSTFVAAGDHEHHIYEITYAGME